MNYYIMFFEVWIILFLEFQLQVLIIYLMKTMKLYNNIMYLQLGGYIPQSSVLMYAWLHGGLL